MGAWVLVSLCPPPPDQTVFVRRGGVLNDAAFDSRRQQWIELYQAKQADMKAPPVEWWDRTLDAPDTYHAPAPITQAPDKGQMTFEF